MILLNVLDGNVITSKCIINGDIKPVYGVIEGNVINNGARIAPNYIGTYEVTPTQYEQILNTKDRRMSENVVVHPIPNNYGLITWDGSILTVS